MEVKAMGAVNSFPSNLVKDQKEMRVTRIGALFESKTC